jgi:hypothetical protein
MAESTRGAAQITRDGTVQAAVISRHGAVLAAKINATAVVVAALVAGSCGVLGVGVQGHYATKQADIAASRPEITVLRPGMVGGLREGPRTSSVDVSVAELLAAFAAEGSSTASDKGFDSDLARAFVEDLGDTSDTSRFLREGPYLLRK